jgi:hypothetical protein
MEVIIITLMITNIIAMNKITKLRNQIQDLKPPF